MSNGGKVLSIIVFLVSCGCATVHTSYDKQMPNFGLTDKETIQKELNEYKLRVPLVQERLSLKLAQGGDYYTVHGLNPLLANVSPDSISKLNTANTFRMISLGAAALAMTSAVAPGAFGQGKTFNPVSISSVALTFASIWIGAYFLHSGVNTYNAELEKRIGK